MSLLLHKAFLIGVIAVSAVFSFVSGHKETPPPTLTQTTPMAEPSTGKSALEPPKAPATHVNVSDETKNVSAQNTLQGAEEVHTQVSALLYYTVIKVIDGDTLSIQRDGKPQTLRLIGVDTPETVDPRKPVQCFGVEASNKAKSILTGQQVRIETDPTQDTYDKYNRLLVYVFLSDGTLFNETMIREGYGHEYTYNIPYKYQSEFKAAENEARTQKKGLWADGVCEQSNIIPVTKTTTVAPAPTPTSTSNYICTADTYNCASFKTHAEAQAVYEACGGSSHDIHRLDADKDGQACESLP